MRAGLYARISDDAANDESGVLRQLTDMRAYCKANDLIIAAEYVDNDISASKRKLRPQYELLLQDVEAKQVDVIVCWHPDRLHRRLAELERFIDVVERAKAEVRTLTAGRIDLTTPSGRMQARMLAVVDCYESEHKAERVSAKMRSKAQAGDPPAGGRRPFGYDVTGWTIVPEEAELLREAAQRVLAGERPVDIAWEWRDRGIRATAGGLISSGNLCRMLRSPRITSLRSYQGEVIGEGEWPAIIERQQWEQLQRVLAAAKRSGIKKGKKHLLTGLLNCACGGRMTGGGTAGNYIVYRCSGLWKNGCGTTISMAKLEAFVVPVVLAACDGPGLAAMLAESSEAGEGATGLLEGLEASLVELGKDYYVERSCSRMAYLEAKQELDARIAALHQKAARQRPVLLDVSNDGIAADWERRSLSWKQAVLRAVLMEIVVRPVGHGYRGPAEDRVTLVWRA